MCETRANGEERKTLYANLIKKEASLESLLNALRLVDESISQLKRQDERCLKEHEESYQQLNELSAQEAAEEKEISLHSVNSDLKKSYSQELNSVEKTRSDICSEIKQLEKEIAEIHQELEKSPVLAEVNKLLETLETLQNSLKRKICSSGVTTTNGVCLLERMLQLTSEREKALRSSAMRERLRTRINALKETHSKQIEKSTLCGPNYASDKGYLLARDKYLREVNTLKEMNSYLLRLVKDTKLSRDGACDRSAALSRQDVLQFASDPEQEAKELRCQIAAASEKKKMLIEKLKALQASNTKPTDCITEQKEVERINSEAELCRSTLKDFEVA